MPNRPYLSTADESRSAALVNRVTARIAEAGPIGFDDYTAFVLYDHELGYYSHGAAQPFGASGDFETAPEMGEVFAGCLARQLLELDLGVAWRLVEYGGGRGRLMRTLLDVLEQQQALPTEVRMIDRSPALIRAQQQALAVHCDDIDIDWQSSLQRSDLLTVVIGNEVLDALPAKRWQWVRAQQQALELRVGVVGDHLSWVLGEPMTVPAEIDLMGLPDGYRSELRPALVPFMAALDSSLNDATILLIDYGYPRAEYFHPQRQDGTLCAYYRHHQHTDPFWLPGICDLSVAVEWTAVAEAAAVRNWQLAGFTSQAGFLLGCGALDRPLPASIVDQASAAHELRKLLTPGQMGELVKVMAWTKGNGPAPVCGFTLADQRRRL